MRTILYSILDGNQSHLLLTMEIINLSKDGTGVVSKNFLEKINNKLNNHLCYNQWHCISTVLDGSKLLKIKKTWKFIKFDIEEFYPSISAKLLEKSINFARKIIEIKENIIDITNHARKSLRFHDGNAWVKKEGNPLFDITMES